jgi:putative hemolysin
MTATTHIVDELIEERAERLMQHPVLWRFIKRVLYPILNYDETVKIIDEVNEMTGPEVMNYVSRRIDLKMQTQGLEHIPETGAAVVLANHPSGIADGVAVWDALRTRREDVMIFANRDAIRAAPGLADLIIPVEWVDDKKTHERSKETVRQMVGAFRSKRLIVIFPSGRLAKPTLTGLQERPWMPTAVSLAQKYQCPIIPMHLGGRNSWFFYCMCVLNTELRDMTLFRELLNKSSTQYRIDAAEAISPEQACGDHKALTIALQKFVAQDMPAGARKFVLEQSNGHSIA